MTISRPSSENINLFRSLFCTVGHAYVVEKYGRGKEVLGKTGDNLFSDDLLQSHFSETSKIGAFTANASGLSDQLIIGIHDMERIPVLRSILAITEGLGYPCSSCVEVTNQAFNVHIFFDQDRDCAINRVGWFTVNLARLDFPARTLSLNVRPGSAGGIAGGGPQRGYEPRLRGWVWLPFHGGARSFVDPITLEPFSDQWSFLRSVKRTPIAKQHAMHHLMWPFWVRRFHPPAECGSCGKVMKLVNEDRICLRCAFGQIKEGQREASACIA